MEYHQLSKKEYEALHKIASEKRAIKELLESLKTQLSSSIIQEDRWWQKIAKKHELDTKSNLYSINHATQEVLGVPRPEQKQAPVAKPAREEGITLRERTPEMNKLVSADELKAMRIARGEITND